MDEHRIRDKAEDLAHKLKDKSGQVGDDAASESESAGEPIRGTTRDLLGKLKDASRRAAEKAREKTETESSRGEKKPDTGDQEEVA